ncbi:hypothetical protein [Massilia sp. ST3]|uniref:hypothetical protein n=1 Tax=Massilia sp. ST3 TaxID=2824903 RepID=UPI001B8352DF|nr:hypothetical protein [Massilia sp. ST3]MBQ5948107.1 hypothetical protein [Massilia sp. ST3]
MPLEVQAVVPHAAQLETAPGVTEPDEAVAQQDAHRAQVFRARVRLDAQRSVSSIAIAIACATPFLA